MRKLKIGIVGCGTIGTKLAMAIDSELKSKASLIGICDLDKQKCDNLCKKLKIKPKRFTLISLFKKSDLIIEAAHPSVSWNILKKAIIAKKSVLIMSIGGLLTHANLLKQAEKKGINVYLPSGAIAGIDAIKGAREASIKTAQITTRKPPKGLTGAPYIVKNKIDLKNIKCEKIIFDGTARQAVKAFPKNINVSALLSLATIGANKVRVKIITSPKIKRNFHEIEVEGSFGRISTKTENVPSPDNPKTSYLAALSAVATLKQILTSVKIGT